MTTGLWEQLEGVSLAGGCGLEQWLGSDRSGAFYLTSFGSRQRRAVLKLIPADEPGEEQFRAWQKLAQLSHPNLLEILDSGRTDVPGGAFFFAVFEYPDDRVSAALQNGPMNEEETREILLAVRDALTYLHSNGMVHGAVDTDHIVAVGDRIKLASDTVRHTTDIRSAKSDDLHSLGETLEELLTGRRGEPRSVPQSLLNEIPRAKAGVEMPPQPPPALSVPPANEHIAPKPVVPAAAKVPPQSVPLTPAPRSIAAQPNSHEASPPKKRTPALPMLVAAVGALVIAIVLAVTHKTSPDTTPDQVPPPSVSPNPRPAAAERAAVPAAPAPTVPVPAPPVQPSRNSAGGPPWRVIAYTYTQLRHAQTKAERINAKWPDLQAKVFSPRGQNRPPYLVSLGGRMTHAEAIALQKRAISRGLARDTFVRNYSD